MTPTGEAVQAMRAYAVDGAKSLAPWLDQRCQPKSQRAHAAALAACRARAEEGGDAPAAVVLTVIERLHWKQARRVHAAYWAIGWA